jgi:hypothetical protein
VLHIILSQLFPPQGGTVTTIHSSSSDDSYFPVACLSFDFRIVVLVVHLQHWWPWSLFSITNSANFASTFLFCFFTVAVQPFTYYQAEGVIVMALVLLVLAIPLAVRIFL